MIRTLPALHPGTCKYKYTRKEARLGLGSSAHSRSVRPSIRILRVSADRMIGANVTYDVKYRFDDGERNDQDKGLPISGPHTIYAEDREYYQSTMLSAMVDVGTKERSVRAIPK